MDKKKRVILRDGGSIILFLCIHKVINYIKLIHKCEI